MFNFDGLWYVLRIRSQLGDGVTGKLECCCAVALSMLK